MKAYNYKCECGAEGDRIIKDKSDVIKCSLCSEVMERVHGPIGGEDVFPEPSDASIKNGFVKFFSKTLNRQINTVTEMKKAYEDMYAVKIAEPVKVEPLQSVSEVEGAVATESPKRGRPKKVEAEA